MMSVLLHCKTCGGKVSSSAIRCPHCGEGSFWPESYLTEQRKKHEESVKQQKEAYRIKRIREEGQEILVYGRGDIPWNNYLSIEIYKDRISQSKSNLKWSSGPNKWSEYGTTTPIHINLFPGEYEVLYKEISVSGPSYCYVYSNAKFKITDSTKAIYLHFRKKLFSKHYKLDYITQEDP